jgi:hypothetical protein
MSSSTKGTRRPSSQQLTSADEMALLKEAEFQIFGSDSAYVDRAMRNVQRVSSPEVHAERLRAAKREATRETAKDASFVLPSDLNRSA